MQKKTYRHEFVRSVVCTSVFKGAVFASAFGLSQQRLSIQFNFITLDFLLPRAPSARNPSVTHQLLLEKAQQTDGRWEDNGGGFCPSVCLTLMALLEIWISCSLRMVPSRSMKYEEASWCRASTPWVALTIFRSSLFLAMYMVSASSPIDTQQYGQPTQDFISPRPKISHSRSFIQK